MEKPKALVVDDELSICKGSEKILAREGYAVKYALSGREALSLLAQEPFDLLFTDLKMAEMSGMELLETLRIRYPDIVPVVITGYATVPSVVESMKLGAYDFLPKPFTPDEMAAVARKAWEKRQLILEARAAAEGERLSEFAGLIGKAPKMQEVYRLIQKVAPTPTTVLIIGESGTGKELVARAVHALSPRQEKPLVAINCAAIPDTLLAAELFGQEKGAFTGAVSEKKGRFELADGGTLFFDEIGEMKRTTQVDLLRVLQEKAFRRLGGTKLIPVDVRLVFATHRDLEKLVAEGSFREDLYYRLYVFPIHLPPLRERKEDVPLLAYHFLHKMRERSGKKVSEISEGVLRLLGEYHWPGNVRQLENVIEQSVISCEGDILEPRHLPPAVTKREFPGGIPIPRTNREFVALKRTIREKAVADLEKEFVLEALERNSWNVTRAALDVGMQRPNFQALMRKHEIRSDKKD
jgi:two-component system response regulator PilR (NtrC family)